MYCGIDLGSTNIKIALYNEDFSLVDRRSVAVTYLREEGFVELAYKFRAVAAIEKTHEERYRKLLNNVEMQQVFEKAGETMWECRNCGHLVVGTKAPQMCPTCAHPQSYFEVHEENY